MDTLSISGKRVVAAGASRGIGRAIAVAFARNGAAVSVCGRDAEALVGTMAEVSAFGGGAHSALCDVAQPVALEAYIEAAAAALGGIDILINNASAFARDDTDGDWSAAFETDLMAAVRATRAALPWLSRSGDGAVVHIASISAFKPTPTTMPYGALKAAIAQLTTSQAFAFASQNVRVNAVAPGAVEFPGHFWERRRDQNDPTYARTVTKIPFGRLGHPDEIADAVLFMASPMARWITGQTLVVDGGQTLAP